MRSPYLIKPFSASELVSRVNAHLVMAQLRSEALRQERTTNRRVELKSLIEMAIAAGMTAAIAKNIDLQWSVGHRASDEPTDRKMAEIYQTSPFAQLAVDFNGRLVVANALANTLFGLTLNDCNRPVQELELAKLFVDCAANKRFDRAYRPVTLKQIEWSASKAIRCFDIYITPIFHYKKYLLGVNFTFYQCRQA